MDRATSAPWTAIRPPPTATPRPNSPPCPSRCSSNCVNAPWPCGPTTRTRARSRSSCRRSFPTCWSTAPPASRSAWPPTSRRTISARSSRAAIFLIENPEATTAQLLDKIKGPDFPLGGKVVTDRATLRKIYEDGSGSIKVQGEWKVETVGKREQIVVTSIPYGVDKGKLEEAIGEIIANRKLPQLLNLVNESNEKDGLRIALEMKSGSDPNLIMAYLYKHTALQDNFSYNMTCLVPVTDEEGKERTRPERLGLKAILRHFLDFRLATVRRRFEYELEQLRRRIHILEGFRIIFNALDKAIKIIRDSDGKADASERLIAAFKLDEEQAAAILEVQLYKIAQLEIKKILDELKEKTAQAEKIEGHFALREKAVGRHQGRAKRAGREVRSEGPAADAHGFGGGRAGVRSGGVHRPREHECGADARRLDQACRPAGLGGGHARP